MSRQITYMDYAAATPVLDEVLKAMTPYISEKFFNPSALYTESLQVKKDINAARAKVAHWLGAKESEIIFTSGGTEANNLAINGIMSSYSKSNIVVSSVEHESVLAPASKYDNRQVPVSIDGAINLDELKKSIDDNTVLVSVMYANNEVGTIQHIREVAKIVNEKRQHRSSDKPLYLHTDACQAANYLDLHVSRLGVDLMTINGGKIYGPKQSGCLFVKSSVHLNPQIVGGGQERGIRSGTENVAGIIGFAKALDIIQSSRHEEAEKIQKLQKSFIEQLNDKLPNVEINGSMKMRLPNNIHITIAGQDNERMLFQLDQAGILAAAGSACSASNEEASHVLSAMGLSEAYSRSSLRFTIGRFTTQKDNDKTLDELVKLAKN